MDFVFDENEIKNHAHVLHDELYYLSESIIAMDVSKTSVYLPCKINGKEVLCLVDTGAEINAIDSSFAVELGIEEYIDTRYSHSIVGVGKSEVLGKIHYLDMEIDGIMYPLSFSVLHLEMKKDHPIIGLPFLMFYKTKLDFNKREITIGGKSINFVIKENNMEKN